jgi:hypothetical protein
VLTATTTTANAALPKSGGTMTGDLTLDSSTHSFLKLDKGASGDYALTRYYTAGTEGWRTGTYNDGTSYVIGTPTDKRLLITTDGNVGIGGVPNKLLHVRDDDSFSGGSRIVAAFTPSISNTQDAGIAFGAYSPDDYWKQGIFWERTGSYGIGNLHFSNRGTADATTVSKSDAKMTIDSSGNVGIGTSAPSVPLTVAANSSGSNISLNGRSSDGYAFLHYRNNADNTTNAEIGVSDAKNMQFYTNGSERMRITSTGNTTINGKFTLTPTGYVGGIQNLASINISSSGSGETRAIDIDGQWVQGESKSINWIHGSSSTNFMGSIDCSYNNPGSSLNFGRMYHSGDSSTYTMSLNSTSLTTANLTVAGNVVADGIVFGPASASNVSSQTLDSYEEGSWTPACAMFTISSTPLATYTKIGNVVNIFCYIEIQNNSGNNSHVRMTGLPFTVKGNHYATGVMNLAGANATINNPHVRTLSNTTSIDLKKDNDAGIIANLVDHAHVLFSVTYFTDS